MFVLVTTPADIAATEDVDDEVPGKMNGSYTVHTDQSINLRI